MIVDDDRSVKPLSASMMRAQIVTKLLAHLYEAAAPLLTSAVKLSVEPGEGRRPGGGPPYAFTMAVSRGAYSGVQGTAMVGRRELDIAFINPSAIVTLAYLGKGPFERAYPLRALAVYPSWDRLVFAVAGDLGVSTVSELKAKRPPLRVSVPHNDGTTFAALEVLRAHGLSLEEILGWGGSVHYVPSPSNPRRLDGIASGEVNAVLDEGLSSWGQAAVDQGMVFLEFDEEALKALEAYGFQRAVLPHTAFRNMRQGDATVVDYSGWPLITHDQFPEDLAYEVVKALASLHPGLPYDAPQVPPLASLCHSTEAGPLGIPLHPGAERYYREAGCL